MQILVDADDQRSYKTGKLFLDFILLKDNKQEEEQRKQTELN